MRGDDLVPLLIPPPSTGLGFRQGVVLTWNRDTAENTIQVGGSIVADVPILNTAEALLLSPGAVVSILTYGSSWFILGRITIPGTPEAAATLGAGLKVASVIGNTPVSNASFALNGGPTVSTQVLPTGRVFVLYGAGMDLDVGEGLDMTVVASGPAGATWTATTSLSGSNLLVGTGLGGTLSLGVATGELVTGLAPGGWTFELHSRKSAGTGNPAVYNRILTIMPQ